MDIRTKRIIKNIDVKNGKGLELGPLTSPILDKKLANIKYVDHLSLTELKEKYKTEPVELTKIVKPDFVLGKQTLKTTLGKKKFDYVIASHVIEHIPNTIDWLRDIASILEPGGVISLVIPDKRFTFDISRSVSSPAEVVGAYYDKLTRFSSAMMYDFASECSTSIDSGTAWNNDAFYLDAPKRWSSEEIRNMCIDNLDASKYVDCHCYVYTPDSFMGILKALIEHDLLEYEVVECLATQPGELEFYVSLRKIDISKATKKRQLKSIPDFEIKESKAEELAHQVAILNQELYTIKHSFSWRITNVLRVAKKTIS